MTMDEILERRGWKLERRNMDDGTPVTALIHEGRILICMSATDVETFVRAFDQIITDRHAATNLQPTNKNEDPAS